MARASSGSSGKTKPQRVAEAVAQAVGAGRAVQLETVGFPILPVNQVATIEGNVAAELRWKLAI